MRLAHGNLGLCLSFWHANALKQGFPVLWSVPCCRVIYFCSIIAQKEFKRSAGFIKLFLKPSCLPARGDEGGYMKQFPFQQVNKWLMMPQGSQSHVPHARGGDQATTFPQSALRSRSKVCVCAQPGSGQSWQIPSCLASPAVQVS